MGFCLMCEDIGWNSNRGWVPKRYSSHPHTGDITTVLVLNVCAKLMVPSCLLPETTYTLLTTLSYTAVIHTDQTTIVGPLEPVVHVDS
jgi:hypothetical protein